MHSENLRKRSLVYRYEAMDGNEPNFSQPQHPKNCNSVPIMQEIDKQQTVEQMNIDTGMQSYGRTGIALSANTVSEARNEPRSTINNVNFTDGMALWNQVRVDDHRFSIGHSKIEEKCGELARQCPQTRLRTSALSSNRLNETARTEDIVQIHCTAVCNVSERGEQNQSVRCPNNVSENKCELPFLRRYNKLTLVKQGEANLTRGKREKVDVRDIWLAVKRSVM